MISWWINMLAILLLAMICTVFIIPHVLLIAFKKRLFDIPDERKIHTGIVPRLGGMAFVPGILFSVFFIIGANVVANNNVFILELIPYVTRFAFGCCAMIVLYMIGLADDLIGVSYRSKFIFQIFSSLILICSGLNMNNLYGVFGLFYIPSVFAYPLTLFMMVYIINAINLIDGIDGLAAGICGVALIFYGFVFIYIEQYLYAILAFASLGTLLVFFYYNVFGEISRGRKIFMGDTGTLTMGLILCFLSVSLINLGNENITNNKNINLFLVAFSPLFLPCVDVIRVFAYRLIKHGNPFLADQNHIHHRLLSLGMSQRKVMLCLILFSLIIISCNMMMSFVININWIIIIDILIYIGFILIIYELRVHKVIISFSHSGQQITTK